MFCTHELTLFCLFRDWYVSIKERSPPIQEVIQAGVVPRFIEFLMREDVPQLQVCFSLGFLIGVIEKI